MKKMEEFERSVTACAVFVSVDVLASKQNGRDSLVIYVIGHLQSCDGPNALLCAFISNYI